METRVAYVGPLERPALERFAAFLDGSLVYPRPERVWAHPTTVAGAVVMLEVQIVHDPAMQLGTYRYERPAQSAAA